MSDSRLTPMSRPDLSAIVLCYRAGTDIRMVIGPLYEQLRASGLSTELVLVANYWPDHSDSTPDVVQAFGEGREGVVVVSEPKQGGMGWDFRTGLDAASGEVMIVLDGDSQNPTEDVVKMFRLMQESELQVMKGLRIARYDGLYRRFISTGYNFLFRALFGTTGLWDINGKPKGIRRGAYEAMTLRSDDWFIDAEIILEARRLGLTVGEMPVVFRRNDLRPSFVRPAAVLEFLRNMLARRARRF
jgi:glycosyltransferase involved in cell wall biosynthesis